MIVLTLEVIVMANYKENLAQWLLIKALIKSGNYEEIEKIADTMIRELKTVPDSE